MEWREKHIKSGNKRIIFNIIQFCNEEKEVGKFRVPLRQCVRAAIRMSLPTARSISKQITKTSTQTHHG
jgi:hypothetical protein